MKRISRAIWLFALVLVTGNNFAGEPFRLSVQEDRGDMVLSWPLGAADIVLERSFGLGPSAAWGALSRSLYQSNASGFSYRQGTAEGQQFFRIRRTGPPVADLTGDWRMDEMVGTTATDLTGLASGLNLVNATWAPGRFGTGSVQFNGQELSVNGSMAWVSNTDFKVLPAPGRPFSVSLWFSPDRLTEGFRRIIGTDANGGDGWRVRLETSGPGTNHVVLTGQNSGSGFSLRAKSLFLPGRWHQLTVTSASNQTKLYLNHVLMAEGAGTLMNHEGPLYLGAIPGSAGSFAGRLDQLRIYTNALSAEQLSVSGHWGLNEGAGELAADAGVNGALASVTASNAWVPGKVGSAIDAALASVQISNEDYRVLPPSGGAFSVSMWIRPRTLPEGRSGLLYSGDGLMRGWQMTVDTELTGGVWVEVNSTNQGGTLSLRVPAVLPRDSWSKLDLTYNGGVATLYVNGTKLRSESGAIQGAEDPIILGAVPGTANFNGAIDELKIHRYERAAAEIGPVALPMWDMALLNTSTNLLLPASGPPGKTLIYSILSTGGPKLGTIDWSPNSPVITYRAGGSKGPDTFVYTVSDGEFTSPPATGVVSVVRPVWLSPEGGAVPRDGSSAAHALAAASETALDAIWRTNNYYDCFFYAPGEYHTTGARYLQRSTANPGCKHIGSGAQPGGTVIKLVNTWSAWDEGIIFSGLHHFARTDGFEVHNLVLDCNAQNNPKFAVGEPVWLRVPLAQTTRVEQVVLRWANAAVPGVPSWKTGPAAAYELCTRMTGANGSNCVSLTNSGPVESVEVGAETDEVVLELKRRSSGVDFYGLAELELGGGEISLPRATRVDGGESRLDAERSILLAVDQNTGTAWASGAESEVHLTLPLASGAAVTQVQFHWNCQTLPDLRRLGPAGEFMIFARDPKTGQYNGVPFVRHGRSSAGRETVTFGDGRTTNSVATDRVLIVLTSRESGVEYYSLKEVTLLTGPWVVPLRMPAAMNMLWSHNFLRAFDGDGQTAWISGTQGAISAIDVQGSNLKFTGLKVVGFGTKAVKECFPLYVVVPQAGPGTDPVRNILVENCLFTDPATNNTDGMSAVVVMGPNSGSLQNAVVRGCTVSNVRSRFTYSHGFAAPLVENCVVDECDAAIYLEPDPAGLHGFGELVIRSNLFQNVANGITISFHAGGRVDSVVSLGNEMVLREDSSGGYGIGGCDTCQPGPTGITTNLVAVDNIIRYRDWQPRPEALHAGLLYGNIQHALFANNVIALGTGHPLRVRQYPSGSIPEKPLPEDCDQPGLVTGGRMTVPPSMDPLLPGYRRAWYNNRDLEGSLLPVRHTAFGVDRAALQQQWPE